MAIFNSYGSSFSYPRISFFLEAATANFLQFAYVLVNIYGI